MNEIPPVLSIVSLLSIPPPTPKEGPQDLPVLAPPAAHTRGPPTIKGHKLRETPHSRSPAQNRGAGPAGSPVQGLRSQLFPAHWGRALAEHRDPQAPYWSQRRSRGRDHETRSVFLTPNGFPALPPSRIMSSRCRGHPITSAFRICVGRS